MKLVLYKLCSKLKCRKNPTPNPVSKNLTLETNSQTQTETTPENTPSNKSTKTEPQQQTQTKSRCCVRLCSSRVIDNDDFNPFVDSEKLRLYRSININQSLLIVVCILIATQLVTVYTVTKMSFEFNHKFATMTDMCTPLFQHLSHSNNEAQSNTRTEHTTLTPDEVTKFTFQVVDVIRLAQTLKRNQCSNLVCNNMAVLAD